MCQKAALMQEVYRGPSDGDKHLALADRNIAEGEVRVQRQRALIERLERRGAATTDAENFLGLLRDTLAGWRRERRLIVAELERPFGR